MRTKEPAQQASQAGHSARLDDSQPDPGDPQQLDTPQTAREIAKARNLAGLEFEREKAERRLQGAEARREPHEIAATQRQLRAITDRIALVRSL